MSNRSVFSMAALLVCLGLFAVTPAGAQYSPSPDKPSISEHHQKQFELMKDMSQEMTKMTEEMSHGDLTKEQTAQMAQKMKRMSTVMGRMSSLFARPAMSEPEYQKQMTQMRKQMDEMKRPLPSSAKGK